MRVLVLELILLAAAMVAALRCTIPMAAEVAALRSGGGWDALAAQGRDPLRAGCCRAPWPARSAR